MILRVAHSSWELVRLLLKSVRVGKRTRSIHYHTMTELTAASPQDVQLDNAKGVYTMHIDSRNLDSNSLLGKALDQIDADNDGKIEQVCLPELFGHPPLGAAV